MPDRAARCLTVLVCRLCLLTASANRGVNAYLVAEDDGLTLVDAMLPGGGKSILRAAETLGAPIGRIALTHAHGDHIGSLDELAGSCPAPRF